MSLTNEERQQQDGLAKVKLAVGTVFSVHVEVARALGASDDALKAMDNIFKFKGGALGIAQIVLAAKQEGAAGGIDAAISWGVGILAGIAATVLATTPIGVAVVVIIASFGGSVAYDYTISDAVKSTLNNWFSDTHEQNNNNSASLLMVPLLSSNKPLKQKADKR